jgi:hypothetical protein
MDVKRNEEHLIIARSPCNFLQCGERSECPAQCFGGRENEFFPPIKIARLNR